MGFWDDYEVVDQLDDAEGDYSWSCVGILRRLSDGALFWAADGGCSCNGPWEDYSWRKQSGPDTPLTDETWPDLQAEAISTNAGKGAEWANRVKQKYLLAA
jgi:hypothetical protein